MPRRGPTRGGGDTTVSIDSLPACAACGGRLLPVSLCAACGWVAVMPGVREVGAEIACPECRAANPTQAVCDACNARYPFREVSTPPKPTVPCPRCGAAADPSAVACPTCGADLAEEPPPPPERVHIRTPRRAASDYDPSDLEELSWIPGVGRALAEALARHGFNALWKVRQAPERTLAAIPGVGSKRAHAIKDALWFMSVLPPRTEDEAPAVEEYECPLCGCPTARFATYCRDCGLPFDIEEIDERVREEAEKDPDTVLLAFYAERIERRSTDPDLWYAKALVLQEQGRLENALDAVDFALAIRPHERRFQFVRASILGRLGKLVPAADELRRIVRDFLLELPPEVQETLEPPEPDLRAVAEGAGEVPAEPATGRADVGPAVTPPAEPVEAAGDESSPGFESAAVGALANLPVAECDVCEEPLSPEAKVCPACGFRRESPRPASQPTGETGTTPDLGALEELEAALFGGQPPEVERVVEPARRPTRPTPRRRGLVNGSGRINGTERTIRRGLINGSGRINGRGFVNGGGRVNGAGRMNGLVNGTRLVNGNGPLRPRRSFRALLPRYVATAAALLMAVAIIASLIPPQGGLPTSISIDGSFEDWAAVPRYVDGTPAANANVAINSYSFVAEDLALSVYASVRGVAFGDATGYDGLYAFLDTDGSAFTGYGYRGLGADIVAEAYGGNNSVFGVRLYGFAEGTVDWNARTTLGAGRGAARGAQVELQIPADVLDPPAVLDALRLLLYADDFDGNVSHSTVVVGRDHGAIRVTQVPLRSTITATPEPFLRLDVGAVGSIPAGSSWTVSGFSFTTTPGATVSIPVSSLTLTPTAPSASVTLSASASGLAPGSVVEVGFDGASSSPARILTTVGGPARAYYASVAAGKRVDGLFADWTADAVTDLDATPVGNPNVDIDRLGGAVETGQAFFFASVSGTVLDGWSVPARLVPSPPGGGGGGGGTPAPPSRRTGEDVLRVYLDTNASTGAGQSIAGIAANVLVEITGTGGQVTSRTVYRWSGGWQVDPNAVVLVATGGPSIEGSVDLDPADVSNLTLVADARDWRGERDITAVYATRGASAGTRGILGDPGTEVLRSAAIPLPRLASRAVLDGRCDDPAYAGAWRFASASLDVVLGVWDGRLVGCARHATDTTDGPGDRLVLTFLVEGTESVPGPADLRVLLDAAGLAASRGDGSTWVPCACAPGGLGSLGFTTSRSFEFDLAAPVNASGFALEATDGSGGSAILRSPGMSLEGGGFVILLPELEPAVAVGGVLVVLAVLRRRRRR